jgi:hypothetical protein
MQAELLNSDELIGQTDEGLLHLLQGRAPEAAAQIEALRRRRLPKRAAEVVAADLGGDRDIADWLGSDGETKQSVEDAIARDLALPAGSVFLDYPEKKAMFGLNLLVQRRSGEVLRLGPAGQAGLIGLPRIADELYRTARVLRVFVLGKRVQLRKETVVELASMSEAEARERVRAGQSLAASA